MDDIQTNIAREMVADLVKNINENLTIHDFRMVSGPHHTNLIFDVVLPFSVKIDAAELIDTINIKLSKLERKYYAVVTIDRNYN